MLAFGDICRPFQPSHLKNNEFHFFTKLPTKPSSYAVVHRQPWPCGKPTELKTFMQQDFHGMHLGTFGGQSNPHISKTTNFIFSQNSPPSHLAMPWCTDNLGHVENPQMNTFHGIHLGTNLANCKLYPIQNFRAPRLLQYSFGDICRPFQPSHFKNHEFHFFTKLPTKPSTYAVVHHRPLPCAQPSEHNTFMHQDFHGIHLRTFVGLSHPHISKTTNFIFSQISPPSNLAMSWCTDNLGHVQTPPNSKLSCTKIFMVFIWGHL